MYQTLICGIVERNSRGNQSRRLAATFHAKLFQRDADALIDGVGADPQLGRDFLAVVMLVNQQQAFDLAIAQPCDRRSRVDPGRAVVSLA